MKNVGKHVVGDSDIYIYVYFLGGFDHEKCGHIVIIVGHGNMI
jgi:hypothetical protein